MYWTDAAAKVFEKMHATRNLYKNEWDLLRKT